MQSNLDKGKKGEDIAADFLVNKGYKIVERNYRYQRSEVDIIAEEGEVCVFIEVKYREGKSYGHPEEAVTTHKLEMIAAAAEQYWHLRPEYKFIRYDIIAITVDKNSGQQEVYHIQDVYF